MTDMELHVRRYCQKHALELALCFAMPAGYEDAYGMYDPPTATVFLNRAKLESSPAHAGLFYLYHELRHAAQYQKPDLFAPSIIKSLDYVIGYNGVCWKRVGDDWKSCSLEGSEVFFTQMYLGQPHEMDANIFAYQQVKALLGDLDELKKLHTFWTPASAIPFEQYEALYAQIDQKTG